jgi:hypothetical protein
MKILMLIMLYGRSLSVDTVGFGDMRSCELAAPVVKKTIQDKGGALNPVDVSCIDLYP